MHQHNAQMKYHYNLLLTGRLQLTMESTPKLLSVTQTIPKIKIITTQKTHISVTRQLANTKCSCARAMLPYCSLQTVAKDVPLLKEYSAYFKLLLQSDKQ